MSHRTRKAKKQALEILDKVCKVATHTEDLFKHIKKMTKRKGKRNDRTDTNNRTH